MKFKNKKGRAVSLAALIAAVVCLAVAVFGALGGLFGASDGVGAGGHVIASADTEWFWFDSVRFEATVNEDKTLDVTETLVTVWDTYSRRSLIRDIQKQSKTTRIVNGKKISGKNYFAKISDISATLDGGECDWHIIPKNDDMYLSDFYSIEMMQTDGSCFVEGQPYTFVLKYKYDMGDDRIKNFDDLTLDIFGYDMNSAKEFSAKITFPESVTLNEDDVTVRTESVSLPTDKQSLVVNGNVVEIKPMPRKRGLTLQVILPKGTFTGGITMYWYYWVFLIAAVASVIGIILLFVKNMPVKPVEPVEFYPPEGVSVMQFSAIWHKVVKSQDAAALILKWADMGLIDIQKNGSLDLILRLNTPVADEGAEKTVAGKNYFDSSAERQYFKTLFSGIGGSDTSFSTTVFRMSGEYNQRKLYDSTKQLTASVADYKVIKPVKKVQKLIPFMGLIPTLMIVVYNCIVGSTFLPLFFFIFMAAGTFAGASFINEDGSLLSPLVLIFPVVFYAMPFGMFIWQFAMPLYDYAYLLYIAPAIYAVCMFILPHFVGKRTEEANVLYGRIRGFRHFLLTAELSRISLLFDENPDYFSDILPWCMIMGISNKVQKRFAALKSINMPKVLEDNIDVRFVSRCIAHSSFLGAPRSSGSGGGGGGGGRGGSHGGGGGGGGSRSR